MGKDLTGREIGIGIHQRKDGKYEARFIDRFGNRVSLYDVSLKNLKVKFNEAKYKNDIGENISGKVKLDDWYKKWLEIYKCDVIRENTKRHYEQVYRKHISPVLGRKNLDSIKQIQIKSLLKQLKDDGYSYETRNKCKILLNDMFNKAVNDEFVKRNPVKGVQLKRDVEREVKVLTVQEQKDFFDCCKGTFYDNFFIVAVATGLRIGELAALTLDDIDFEKKLLYVNRTLVYQKYLSDEKKEFHIEEPKTKKSKRAVPINKQCLEALKKQIKQKNVIQSKMPSTKQIDDNFKDFIFTTKFNTPLNSQIICDAIKKIVDEINLTRYSLEEMETFSCHCFRHTFATRCFEADIQPKTVQSYLGHATLQMTMDLYTSVLQEYECEEMKKLESKLDSLKGDIYEENNENAENNESENLAYFDDKKYKNFHVVI